MKIAALGGEVTLVEKVGGSMVMKKAAIAALAILCNTCHH